MFVIQRGLEGQSKLTLLDEKRVLVPLPALRLFAAMNTLGQGNFTRYYPGAQFPSQMHLNA
jgi:cobaltochelatase CobS